MCSFKPIQSLYCLAIATAIGACGGVNEGASQTDFDLAADAIDEAAAPTNGYGFDWAANALGLRAPSPPLAKKPFDTEKAARPDSATLEGRAADDLLERTMKRSSMAPPTLRWMTTARGTFTTSAGTSVIPVALRDTTTTISLELTLPAGAEHVELLSCAMTNTFDPAIAPRIAQTDAVTRTVPCDDGKLSQRGHNIFVYELRAADLLTRLQTKENENALFGKLRFRISYMSDSKDADVQIVGIDTPGLLHAISQRPIIVLPGFGASAFWTSDNAFTGALGLVGLNAPTWPNPTGFGRFGMKPDGTPELPATWTRPVIKGEADIFGDEGKSPFNTQEMSALAEAACPNCLDLNVSYQVPRLGGWVKDATIARRLWHYPVYLRSYDWRLPVSTLVDDLLVGPEDPNDPSYDTRYMDKWYLDAPSYNRPWPLGTLLRFLRTRTPEFQFAREKAIVVAHSYGGVILNIAMRRPGAERAIDTGYIVNAPFFGSFKSFDMLFGFHDGAEKLAAKLNFRVGGHKIGGVIQRWTSFYYGIAGTLPVFYTMAPWRPVSVPPTSRALFYSLHPRGNERPLDVSAVTDSSQFLPHILNDYAEAHEDHPIARFQWNQGLHDDAQRMRDEWTSSPVVIENHGVFYSRVRTGEETLWGHLSTPGPIEYNGHQRGANGKLVAPVVRLVEGDGTVDIRSLQARGTDLDGHRQEILDDGTGEPVDHAMIPLNKNLWQAMIRKVHNRLPLGD